MAIYSIKPWTQIRLFQVYGTSRSKKYEMSFNF